MYDTPEIKVQHQVDAVEELEKFIESSTMSRCNYVQSENERKFETENVENENNNPNEYDMQVNSKGRNCRIKYVCFACSKKFNIENLYLQHLKAHSTHSTTNKYHQQCKCDICQQVFKNEDRMRHHQQFHFI